MVNRVYVTGVLVSAAVGAGAWAFVDPSKAVSVATAVLVVTCPCALGLATPLAFHLALAGLRRRGIFVRTLALLEKARHVRRVVFDKTGTVTWGGLHARVLRAPPDALLDVLRTMVSASNHPVSRAIAEAIDHGPFQYLRDLTVTEHPGRGVEARDVADRVYRLGRADFAGGDRGAVTVFTVDGEMAAEFALDEDYRPGAAEEIADLVRDGCEVHLLSGDVPDKVRAAALRLGLPPDRAQGGLGPAEKAAFIDAVDRDDTLMIGDGLNDAPAFDRAWCAGTPALDRPVMPSRSDFAFVGATSGSVRAVLDTARRMHRVIVLNLSLAAVYNAVALVLSFAGLMSPLLCAILMPLSSLLLIGHTVARLGGAR